MVSVIDSKWNSGQGKTSNVSYTVREQLVAGFAALRDTIVVVSGCIVKEEPVCEGKPFHT